MIPTSIKEEMTYNVFLRSFDKDMQELTFTKTALECFKALRLHNDLDKEPQPPKVEPEQPLRKKAKVQLVKG